MRILFISNNFPPEVNAPATRLYEHAINWVDQGHEVEVLTSAPNFPEGVVYSGYENRYTREEVDGIKVTRVPTFITKNRRVVNRTIGFISFMMSARYYATHLQLQPDIVVATSPQIFAGLAGNLVGRFLKKPFVLEIRDLWPESIVAVSAMRRNWMIVLLERLELFLYRRADHIVVVTKSFKRVIQQRGINAGKITVIPNGANLDLWSQPADVEKVSTLRTRLGLDGKFVVSYIGTIGAAHKADILLDAAQKCLDPDIVFMVVGTGAERDELEQRMNVLGLANFRLLDKVPREEVRHLMELSDLSIVHLKASPLFETVIPSKIFEAMATGTPIILGVGGEAREIIEDSEAGVCIEPEQSDELVRAVELLKRDSNLRADMTKNGMAYVQSHFDRRVLARQYLDLLNEVIMSPDLKSQTNGDDTQVVGNLLTDPREGKISRY